MAAECADCPEETFILMSVNGETDELIQHLVVLLRTQVLIVIVLMSYL